ncbi:MAG: nicotinate-nucleotide adenylyltransferase [Candidatus Glassbacteria bacterium]
MKKLGVFGGSFDPIHTGHLIVAQDVLCALSLDEIMFIPACVPPHKKGIELSETRHRLRMVEIATHNNPNFSASDMELKRGGVSYTIDTIRQLRSGLSADVELFFIVGSDNIPDIQTWKEPWELVKLCKLVTIHRPGFRDIDILPELKEHVTSVAVTSVDISSRDIRQRVRNGRPIRYLVPEEVERYILKEELYKSARRS